MKINMWVDLRVQQDERPPRLRGSEDMTTGITAGPTREATLAHELDRYLQHLRHFRQLADQTITAYRADGQSFLRWCEAQSLELAPADITQAILMQYLGDQAGLSANSLRRRVHALSGWFRFMMREGVMSRNPAERLPLPRRVRSAPKYPTSQEVTALIAAARTPLERVVISLLAGTGLRRAELLGLDLSDLADGASELRVVGKGDRPRCVPIPTAVQSVVREYLAVRGDAPGPLLLNRAGRRLGITSLRRLFDRLLRRAGLQDEGFTPHALRHAYASTLIRAGVDLGSVRDLLGHADISVTGIYVHSDLRSRREAVERLLLGLPGGEDHGD